MATYRIKISMADLPRDVKERRAAVDMAVETGLTLHTERARQLLKRLTPVDRGMAKNAWKKQRTGKKGRFSTHEVVNNAPYAGVLERGARPHSVSKEGIAAINGWVRRHFPGADEEQINAITMGIVWKLRKHGQKPTYFVRNAMAYIQSSLTRQINKQIKAIAGKRLVL